MQGASLVGKVVSSRWIPRQSAGYSSLKSLLRCLQRAALIQYGKGILFYHVYMSAPPSLR